MQSHAAVVSVAAAIIIATHGQENITLTVK